MCQFRGVQLTFHLKKIKKKYEKPLIRRKVKNIDTNIYRV